MDGGALLLSLSLLSPFPINLAALENTKKYEPYIYDFVYTPVTIMQHLNGHNHTPNHSWTGTPPFVCLFVCLFVWHPGRQTS
jgi:hypothetical protein